MSTMSGPFGEVAFVRQSRALRIRRLLLARASVLVAQTEEGAEELRSLAPAQPVVVVPNPIPVPAELPELPGGRVAVYSGRLAKIKNLTTLLHAWTQVADQLPDARLVLVGDAGAGDRTGDDLRRQISSDARLSASVSITGWVDDVGPYLDRSDVFVLPSAGEGLSNSLLEACARGRVAVVSDIPGNIEVVGADYPLVFNSDDVDALARCLGLALTDPAAREDARRRIADRLARFSHPAVIEKLERQLLRTRGA
jgi:glycosyltransferase involved in cell wall biosynthesis